MQLSTRKISTERFTWIADKGEFVAEVSDLGDGSFPLDRIYDDACDAGFTLVSHRTGREIVVGMVGEYRDRDDDLLWIDYEPVDWQAARSQTEANIRVRILND